MLNYSKTSVEINAKMYNAKLPCYIYNYGAYYLIKSMTYIGPANSCQSVSKSNTTSDGLYFYMIGTTSGGQSIGHYYSEQSINPYNYSKMGMKINYQENLSYNYARIGLYNGSISSENWASSIGGGITLKELDVGENEYYQDLSNLNVNSNYRLGLMQGVNKYQLNGNYYNKVYIRSIWLQ